MRNAVEKSEVFLQGKPRGQEGWETGLEGLTELERQGGEIEEDRVAVERSLEEMG